MATVDAIEQHVLAIFKTKNWFNATQGMSSYARHLADMGPVAGELIDAALERLAPVKGWRTSAVGASIRLALQQGAFRATRSADRVMPTADACWVAYVADVIGHGPNAVSRENPLENVRPSDIARLFNAWSDLDWDGQLRIEGVFGRERRQRPIGKRPWAELARLAGTSTSFNRLVMGESESQTVTQLFAHKDATIDDKLALAAQLANRAKGTGWVSNDGLALVARVLAPHLAKAKREMPAALQRVAA